jgi:chaperonin GroEL (HSP60 family)
MSKNSLPSVLSSKYDHVKGIEAWRKNLQITALAVDRVRSSLGPNGAYKMVTYNRGPEKIIKITKDAVPVLEEFAIQFPIVTVVSEAAKIQRQEIGDGVTQFAIFTSALLRKADELESKGIHPNTILQGYLEAAKKALEIINTTSNNLENDQMGKILETVDCGKQLLTKETSGMLLEAYLLTTKGGKLDKDKVRIIRKPGGTSSESILIKGVMLKKGKVHPHMPDIIENPRIAVTSERIGLNRLEVKMRKEGPPPIKLEITKALKLAEYQNAEKDRKVEALERIKALHINVLFCQQPIDSFTKSKLCEMGVLAFETVNREDCELISRATNASLVGNLLEMSERDIGKAEKAEIGKIGLEKTVILVGCDNVTFLLRGSTQQALDEFESLIHNSLTILQFANSEAKTVPGGGAIEMHLAKELQVFAMQFPGKEQLAILDFAEALMEIPRCLALNYGLNANDTIGELRRLHAEGFSEVGIGPYNCQSNVCVELSEVKSSIIKRAYEVASLLLRIDEQITWKESVKFHKK